MPASAPGRGLEISNAVLDLCGVNVLATGPAGYATGFNDRGAETMRSWLDTEQSFTAPDLFDGLQSFLGGQLDSFCSHSAEGRCSETCHQEGDS